MRKIMRKIMRRAKENFPISVAVTFGVAMMTITTKMALLESVTVCTMVFILSLLFRWKRRK